MDKKILFIVGDEEITVQVKRDYSAVGVGSTEALGLIYLRTIGRLPEKNPLPADGTARELFRSALQLPVEVNSKQ